jgi:diguanylate cyclase (GGDEF)-like protein
MGESTEETRRILLVDDDDQVRSFLSRAVSRNGFEVYQAESIEAANELLESGTFQIALVDQELPDGSGLDFLQNIHDAGLDTRVVIITGHGELQSAIRALRLGATDYIQKPFADLAALKNCLENSMKAYEVHRQRRRILAELKDQNQTLEALAVRDPLTHLFTHVHFQEVLEEELERCQRNQLACGLLLIRIDGLRSVNNTQGHAAGDRLLCEVARIIDEVGVSEEGIFRRRAQDIPARFSGSRLALLLPETPPVGASVVAERLRQQIASHDFSPLGLPEQTISIGGATFPKDGVDRVALVESAKVALDAASRGGSNRLVAYTPALSKLSGRGETVKGELERLDALEDSIAKDRFKFVYQPIVYAETGNVFAYEALCRPEDPVFPHPGVLIETAQRAGQVVALGRSIRKISVRALEQLSSNSLLFVNIHPHELFDREILSPPEELKKWADRVVFEITEVAGVKDYGRVREVMEQLRDIGYRIALDDLGAGYSGLNSLASLQPDFVKLDMHLVRRIRDARTARLTRHLVEFAQDENMAVVAEGVETDDERQALIDLGCTFLQGYYFGKGRPIAEIVDEPAQAAD